MTRTDLTLRSFAHGRSRRGSALLMALIMLTSMAMLTMCMLSAGMSGSQIGSKQDDDYRLRSAAESTGNLAIENLWSGYLRANGGGAGDIGSFRGFLASEGILAGANSGFGKSISMLQRLPMPHSQGIDSALIDDLSLVRRDRGLSTELFFTVSASSRRGEGHAHGGTKRTMQLVYSIQPASFEGFDYAILTRNVNCIFCHTKIDTTERAFNTDPALYDTFARAKVGTLESMEIRNDGKNGITDQDADTLLAGTLYIRGSAYTGSASGATGVPITDWKLQSMISSTFDAEGQLTTDNLGNLVPNFFTPGDLAAPMENLYLNYPLDTAHMVDGVLPADFPPPFPDDGGLDPVTGVATSAGASNKIVDANEFYAATQKAEGTVSGGAIYVSGPGATINSDALFKSASSIGNTASLGPVTHGNVILSGTTASPIVINGTVAIEGDVVLQGVIKGKGVILAKGNMYMPTSVTYADGKKYLPKDLPGMPSGPRTFGVAQDGTLNEVAYASGGNLMIGDYLSPSAIGGSSGSSGSSNGNSSSNSNNSTATTNSGKGKNNTTTSNGKTSTPAVPAISTTDPIVDGTTRRLVQLRDLGDHELQPHGVDLHAAQAPGQGPGPDQAGHLDGREPDLQGPRLRPALLPVRSRRRDPDLQQGHRPVLRPGRRDLARSRDALQLGHDDDLAHDPGRQDQPAALRPEDRRAQGHDPAADLERRLAARPDLRERHQRLGEAAQTQGTPFQVDGLMYTNNAIFGIIHRSTKFDGAMNVNGSMICADLGLLAPGVASSKTQGTSANLPGSGYKIGLTLNYDARLTDLLDIPNPYRGPPAAHALGPDGLRVIGPAVSFPARSGPSPAESRAATSI